MPVSCSTVTAWMEALAPLHLAEEWDNPGLLAGDCLQEISRILVALDATEEVVFEAIQKKADMIVTHHPLLMKPVKSVTKQTPLGRKLYPLIQHDICLYAAHTNLDVAYGGTNDVLAELLGLLDVGLLDSSYTDGNGRTFGCGRVGRLPEKTRLSAFAAEVKKKLGLSVVRVSGDENREIQKIALCTGSGMGFLEQAIAKGADLYMTADIKFHDAQRALSEQICLLDATHYHSEVIVVPRLCSYLQKTAEKEGAAVEVLASEVNGDPFLEL